MMRVTVRKVAVNCEGVGPNQLDLTMVVLSQTSERFQGKCPTGCGIRDFRKDTASQSRYALHCFITN